MASMDTDPEMAQATAMIDQLLAEKQCTVDLLRACQEQLEDKVTHQAHVIAQQQATIAQQALLIQQLQAKLAAADEERATVEVEVGVAAKCCGEVWARPTPCNAMCDYAQVGKFIVESQDRVAALESRLAAERRANALLASTRSSAGSPGSRLLTTLPHNTKTAPRAESVSTLAPRAHGVAAVHATPQRRSPRQHQLPDPQARAPPPRSPRQVGVMSPWWKRRRVC